jgi:putative endonuclease
MFYVYILRSTKNGNLYKGLTKNLEKRILGHNEGRNTSTKANRPWELVYFEKYNTRTKARAREKYLKSGEGRELLKKLIKK